MSGQIITAVRAELKTHRDEAIIASGVKFFKEPVTMRWVEEYVNNWATCDTFCTHAVGSFVERFPEYTGKLKVWAKSPNRWVRRAAAVSLVLPARRGEFLDEALEIARILLEDRDDLVQKGYGWLLKEASRKHQENVFDFVMKHRTRLPRTALRYAIEKMPAHLREQAMAK